MTLISNNFGFFIENNNSVEFQGVVSDLEKSCDRFLKRAEKEGFDIDTISKNLQIDRVVSCFKDLKTEDDQLLILKIMLQHFKEIEDIEDFKMKDYFGNTDGYSIRKDSGKLIDKFKRVDMSELPYKNFKVMPLLFCVEYRNITELHLASNELTEIPQSIFMVQNLTFLNLCGNNIQTIPDGIGQLKELRQFSVAFNQVSKISDELWQLDKLEQLDLSHNSIKTFSPNIKNFKVMTLSLCVQCLNIMALNLESNELTAIPQSIFMFQNLIFLNLDKNKIQTIPDGIGRLKKLGHFSVAFNQVSKISDELWQLDKLKELDLSYTNIKTFSPNIKNLKNLEGFAICENNIGEWPDPSVFDNLQNLERIGLTLPKADISLDQQKRFFDIVQKLEKGGVKFFPRNPYLLIKEYSPIVFKNFCRIKKKNLFEAFPPYGIPPASYWKSKDEFRKWLKEGEQKSFTVLERVKQNDEIKFVETQFKGTDREYHYYTASKQLVYHGQGVDLLKLPEPSDMKDFPWDFGVCNGGSFSIRQSSGGCRTCNNKKLQPPRMLVASKAIIIKKAPYNKEEEVEL